MDVDAVMNYDYDEDGDDYDYDDRDEYFHIPKPRIVFNSLKSWIRLKYRKITYLFLTDKQKEARKIKVLAPTALALATTGVVLAVGSKILEDMVKENE